MKIISFKRIVGLFNTSHKFISNHGIYIVSFSYMDMEVKVNTEDINSEIHIFDKFELMGMLNNVSDNDEYKNECLDLLSIMQALINEWHIYEVRDRNIQKIIGLGQ